jgi:hypothetical protein
MEKHIQTIIGIICAGLISWVGLSVNENSKQIYHMSEVMKDFKEFTKTPRFTQKDFSVNMIEYEARLILLEKKVLKNE